MWAPGARVVKLPGGQTGCRGDDARAGQRSEVHCAAKRWCLNRCGRRSLKVARGDSPGGRVVRRGSAPTGRRRRQTDGRSAGSRDRHRTPPSGSRSDRRDWDCDRTATSHSRRRTTSRRRRRASRREACPRPQRSETCQARVRVRRSRCSTTTPTPFAMAVTGDDERCRSLSNRTAPQSQRPVRGAIHHQKRLLVSLPSASKTLRRLRLLRGAAWSPSRFGR